MHDVSVDAVVTDDGRARSRPSGEKPTRRLLIVMLPTTRKSDRIGLRYVDQRIESGTSTQSALKGPGLASVQSLV